MNSQYAPVVRVILRWLAGITGGASLATDQDLVAVGCLIVGGLVEAAYAYAKSRGKPT